MFQTKHDLTGLRELLTGTKRYNELRRAVIGVSPKVLTENLRDMAEDGLLNRRVYPEVPPRVEYTLTTKGEDLRPIIEAMKGYGEKYSNAE